jgi:glycerol-3-phosphate acyltransferase PlsY
MICVWTAWWIGAYIVGSIPIGFLLARSKGVDIRNHGSGNIGATNVWRVLGPRLGAICFALDMLKGMLPVLLAGLLNGTLREIPEPGPALSWMGVAAAAILGHMFPVWLRFKGGKGVATGFGALLGVWPIMTAAAVGALVAWLISARITRYVGISSCFAAVSMPMWVGLAGWAVVGNGDGLFRQIWAYELVAVLLATVVVVKHRGNIRRTLNGTERRIGQRVRVGESEPRGASPRANGANG